jgi:hypothetical protein
VTGKGRDGGVQTCIAVAATHTWGDTMALTPEQHAAREGKITGSFLPVLMEGDPELIEDKWKELNGDPSWKPKDFSRNWAVQRGLREEQPGLNWHEITCGQKIIRRGEVVGHPSKDYVACTLDGFREHDNCTIEFKSVGGHEPIDVVIARYTPQVIAQVRCAGAARGALLIENGASEPVEYPIEIDAEYEKILWTRVDQFWDCVTNLMAPIHWPKVTPPELWRSVDLDGDCSAINWAADMRVALAMWDNYHDDAEHFEQARDDIKTLLPEDVGLVTSGFFTVKRLRNRAVTIKRARA